MCRLKYCERVDGLRGSIHYVPADQHRRIAEYYLAHLPEWKQSPQGQARIKRATTWFLSHLAKRPD